MNGLDKIISEAREVISRAQGAKLSTKKRKGLRASQFCGPNRSFPVPDCPHYTAALRLLNRSKYSGSTKAKIRACVMRKGKALGCGGAKKEKAFEEAFGMSIEELINSEVFAETRALVEESIKNPGMDLDLSTVDIEEVIYEEV